MLKIIRSAQETRNDKIVRVIWGAMAANGITMNAAATAAGMTATTLRNRKRNPQNFTIAELLKIARVTGASIEDIRQAITY